MGTATPRKIAAHTSTALASRLRASSSTGPRQLAMPVQLYKQAYHFTHVANLPGIARTGLLSHRLVREGDLEFVDISDNEVQPRRSRPEPVFRRSIHDYVPMYLNPRNAMLYKLRDYAEDLVMLAVDMDGFEMDDVVYTDGNAACAATRFAADIRVTVPSIPALCAAYWNDVPEGKRRRCAEMLVPDQILPSRISSVYCRDPGVRDFASRVLKLPTSIDRSLYF